MANTVLYVRDPQTAQLIPIKAYDNLDGTYTLNGSGDASQATVLLIKAVTDLIPNAGAMTSVIAAPAAALASNTQRRQAGVWQAFSGHITSACNAGYVTVCTVTTQSCIIVNATLRSNGSTTGNLTSAGIYGGAAASGSAVIIPAATATQAALSAVDKQVTSIGFWSLPATKLIQVNLLGAVGTAVDLQLDIVYMAVADGGYLV